MSATRISSPEFISNMPVGITSDCPETRESPVIIGLGANLGRPRAQLSSAVQALQITVAELLGVAGLYRSAPIGPEQPDFLNSATLIQWPDHLSELLSRLQTIEHQLGRQRKERWGPRTVDLDILWAGDRRVQERNLTVPHPELAHRAFALLPLLELRPDAKAPGEGRLYRDALETIRSQRIERIAGPEWSHHP